MGSTIVKDEPADVLRVVSEQVANPNVHVVITTGGTGLTSRDRTYEALTSLLERRLDGFGELFRMLSYHDIGAAAMLSRAVAGTVGGTFVAALPGSEGRGASGDGEAAGPRADPHRATAAQVNWDYVTS